MNTEELNNYFKHYLLEDKTNSAIMLSAPWGTGKSHYIKTELIPFLQKNKLGYAMISLYGINDLAGISKSLYLELRLNKALEKAKSRKKIYQSRLSKWFSKHGREVAQSVLGVGKTIIKGIASIFNVDINFSEKDLQKIYKSVNLTNKLIILEDLERSCVDLIEIMGFVNNLVEQDQVKVLLVANEDEIIETEYKEEIDENSKDQSKKRIKVLTKNSKKYLEIKEKTVSDTIRFNGQVEQSIENILLTFNSPIINLLVQERDNLGYCKLASELYNDIMQYSGIQSENLRALIYACQKTTDIFNSVENKIDMEFAKTIFMSNVAFSLRKKKNDKLNWDSKTSYSNTLGTFKYPLLEYCFNNICLQYNNPEEFKDLEKNFIVQQAQNKKLEKNNADLRVIYSFYEKSEAEVIDAVKHIKELLKDTSVIYPTQYGRLANFLIGIKDAIGNNDDIDECKHLMLLNIPTVSCNDLADRITHHGGLQLVGDALVEYQAFTQEMLNAISKKQVDLFDFDYTIEHLEGFCEEINGKHNMFLSCHSFARKIDNEKLSKLLMKCSAYQIDEIHGMYQSVYSMSNINTYFMDDKDALIDLRQKIHDLIERETPFDKIQILQLGWFLNTIDGILEKLQ